MRTMKQCSKCGQELPKANFSAESAKKDGLKAWCRACNKKYVAEHYQNNKQKYIDKAAKWKESNEERRAEIVSKHKKNNRAYYTENTAKYRADKDNRTPKCLTAFDHLHIKCLYQVAAMRSRESGQLWSVDHVIPLRGETVSGLHVPWNMQVITLDDNTRKNNKLILPEEQTWA